MQSRDLETRLFVYGEFLDENGLGGLFSNFTLVSNNAVTTTKMFYIPYNGNYYLVDPQTASVAFDKLFLKYLRKSKKYLVPVKGKVYNLGSYDILFGFDISLYPKIRAGISLKLLDSNVKCRVWTYYFINVEELRKINWLGEVMGIETI